MKNIVPTFIHIVIEVSEEILHKDPGTTEPVSFQKLPGT